MGFHQQKLLLKSQFTSISGQSLGLGAGAEGLVERMKVLLRFLLLLQAGLREFFLHPLGWSCLNQAAVPLYEEPQLPRVNMENAPR